MQSDQSMGQTGPASLVSNARGISWRRLLQFRLRTLLILTTLAAVAFAMLGYEVRRASRQRLVADMAEKPWEPNLEPSGFPDVWYKPRVFWNNTSQMPKWLRSLAESYPNLLCDVTELLLQRATLSDADLVRLASLDRLEILDLLGAKFEGTGVRHLQSLTRLQRLDLSYTTVTDKDLVNVAPLTELKRLSLRDTRITGAGLEPLSKLANLEHLDLGETNVDDAAVPHLVKLSKLTRLHLEATQVSEAGAHRIERELPRCLLFWRPRRANSDHE